MVWMVRERSELKSKNGGFSSILFFSLICNDSKQLETTPFLFNSNSILKIIRWTWAATNMICLFFCYFWDQRTGPPTGSDWLCDGCGSQSAARGPTQIFLWSKPIRERERDWILLGCRGYRSSSKGLMICDVHGDGTFLRWFLRCRMARRCGWYSDAER